ncbi:MAG: hypothetical protein ABSF32_05925 [Ignavibacteria bacterium]|jgi:hypothetical protein
MEEKVYKYRMDVYYQTLVLYLVFFFLYALIKGKFFEEKFELVFNDPIIYIFIIFIPIIFLFVLLNFIRGRQIILLTDRIVLKNRFGKREILNNEILNIKIGRKRKRREDMPYRIIKLKLRNRKKWLRIRANDFEHGSELIREFLRIKNPVHP